MAGNEETFVVECYPTNVYTNDDMQLEMDRPMYSVKGTTFSRFIYRPCGRPDILLGQLRNSEDMYNFDSFLPEDVLQNRNNLYQGIAAFPPTMNVRIIPNHFNNLGWTWQNVATTLAEYVDETCFDSVNPFIIEGEEAFGTITLRREANRWRNESWRQDPPPAIAISECGICLDDITEDPISDLLGLHCCQHMFHKRCILKWVWENHVTPKCPTCNQLI